MLKLLMLVSTTMWQILVFAQPTIKYISNATGYISYYDKTKKALRTGTGTLVVKPTSNGLNKIFIVTCKHVLPKPEQASFINFQIKNPQSVSGSTTMRINVWDSPTLPSVGVIWDTTGIDIAAINISDSIIKFGITGVIDYSIPSFLLATDDTLIDKQIQIGTEVMFIGFPNYYFDQRNISPILRTAVIASDPQTEFYLNDTLRTINYFKHGEMLPKVFPGFLIDGNVFGGSSGSLVFSKPRFFRIKDGQFEFHTTGENPYILGVLSDSFYNLEDSVQRLNIGGVISVKYLIRLIE